IMIKILKIDKEPLTFIGSVSGECYGTKDKNRFAGIAKRCMKENHRRTVEFVDVVIQFSGYSAKMAREAYTHQHTSKLQASTRYIDYSKKFGEIIPPDVSKNEEALKIWEEMTINTSEGMTALKEAGIKVEDLTNKLPLSYDTTVVYKMNLSTLIHMFGVRSCTCAYHEYRKFMAELKKLLSEIDEEWAWISENYFVPKCVLNLWCDEETRNCGIRPKKSVVEALLKEHKLIK
ncbi:MAG: FAD-dependent thymidylate synthase, partial [Cetobacterium sp.]